MTRAVVAIAFLLGARGVATAQSTTAVTDLQGTAMDPVTIQLQWTIPPPPLPITGVDLRFSATPPVPGNELAWFNAIPASGHVANEPLTLDTQVALTVPAGISHTFALRVGYFLIGVGPLSNVVTVAPYVPDLAGPPRIIDLAATAAGQNTITIQWTVSGDDPPSGTSTLPTGTAVEYDIRYSKVPPASTSPAGLEAWFSASSTVQVLNEPPPATALPLPGTLVPTLPKDGLVIDSLEPLTTYFIGLKSRDEVPANGWSPVSNLIQATTFPFDERNHAGGDAPCGGSAPAGFLPPALLLLPLLLRRRGT